MFKNDVDKCRSLYLQWTMGNVKFRGYPQNTAQTQNSRNSTFQELAFTLKASFNAKSNRLYIFRCTIFQTLHAHIESSNSKFYF